MSLRAEAWCYFGDRQPKLTRSFRPDQWLLAEGVSVDDPDEAQDRRRGRPEAEIVARRSARLAAALAEAVALVDRGRSPEVRRRLARAVTADAAVTDPRVRRLTARLAP